MLKNYFALLIAILAVAFGVNAQETEELTVTLSATWGSNIVPLDKVVTFRAKSNMNADLRITVNDQEIVNKPDSTFAEGKYTFAAKGDYTVTATATANGKTVSSTGYYCIPTPSVPSSLTTVPPMGAFRNADGTVTFCFAAPEKENVILVGSWDNYKVAQASVMDYIDGPADGEGSYRYFVKTVSGIPMNTPVLYYYMVENGTSYKSVGDPYARLVLDPNNDKWISPEVYPDMIPYPTDKVKNVCLAVFQDNFGEYDWKVTDFKGAPKNDLVIYELLFRDFTGTEGKANGDGTVRLAIEKIPYLKSLGINAVELLPINEFDGNLSWGYNPNFYFAIDKAYGTAQDYKEFIDICHQNGIAVILDIVFNQSAGLHPWYQLYDNNKDLNPFYNKTAPHAYSVLNDWKQEYPLVQQQWHDCLKYWLTEYKVDGFRFDLVKGLGNNDSYKNSSGSATNAFNQSRVDRMKRLHDAMREVNPDAYFINELLGDTKEENEMATDGELNWFNNNYNGCEFAMGWKSNLNSMWAPKASRTAGSTVSYLESHDEERLAYKQEMWGATGIKGNLENSCYRLAGAAAQMLMVPGSHMIWQFSEMGNAQSTKSSNGENNTGNKIVNWALMDNPENGGLVDRYRELIHIRLANPELFGETAEYALNFSNTANFPTAPKNLLYAKTYNGDKELHLLINAAVNVELTSTVDFRNVNADNYQILSKWGATDPVIDFDAKTVTVPANGYVVIATKSVESAVNEIAAEPSSAMKVYSNGGVLFVANVSAPVTVWNMAGQKVAAADSDFSASLLPGIYMVRSAGKTVKVMVK